MVDLQRPVVAALAVPREAGRLLGRRAVQPLRPVDVARCRQRHAAHERQARVCRQHLGGEQPVDRAQALEVLLEPQPNAARALREPAEQRRVARLGRVAQRLGYPPAARERLGDAAVDGPQPLRRFLEAPPLAVALDRRMRPQRRPLPPAVDNSPASTLIDARPGCRRGRRRHRRQRQAGRAHGHRSLCCLEETNDMKTADDAREEVTTDVIARLAALPPVDYDQVRVDEAGGLGVRVATLDDAVAHRRKAQDREPAQGQRSRWPEPTPWPEPVDGPALLTGIADFVSTYVHLPTPAASTVALWIVMTWLHDRLDLSSFLHLTSATRRCGKSALLEVIGTLVRRPLMTSHATVAAIFRLIERDGPTLLLDEIDRRFRAADAAVLIGIINSSQRRESAHTYRCTGGNHDLTAFETWCPKAFAGISHLPDTVMDRSIVLRLERQAPGTALRWRDRDRDLVTALQRRILRWVTDNVDAILAARSAVSFPDALHDRARDAWETLLAVGHVAGGDWAGAGRAWAACVYVDADAENEGGPEEQLLVDLRAVFHNEGDPPALATRSILHALHEMDSRPWSRYERGKPLSPQGLARVLKPFHVTPNTVRLSDGGILKGYKREVLDPLWKAYCPGADSHQMSVTPVTPLKTRESSEPRPVTPGGSVP